MTGIVIVTWNSEDVIGSCLDACLRFPGVEIVVVDNASSDSTVAEVIKRTEVRVIANTGNRGFAGGVNQGIAALNVPTVLILNPDAAPVCGVAELARVASDRCVGAAAGMLVDEDGPPQDGFNVRAFPTPLTLAFEVLGLNRILPWNPVNRRYRTMCRGDAVREADQPAAAFLMINRAAWESIGGFDEGFHPVWFEDVDFCFRLKAAGYRVLYVPQAAARHIGGHSATRVRWEDRQVFWYGSLLRYAGLHFRPAGRRLVAVSVILGFLMRTVGYLVLKRRGSVLSVYSRIFRLACCCWDKPSRFSDLQAGGLSRKGEKGPAVLSWATQRMHNDFVSVTIVTWNSGQFIKRCLESVLAQKYDRKEIIVVDNNSTDGTIDILEQFDGRCRIIYNDDNIGFAAAQNQAIAASRGDWVMTLNPDVLLLPGFIQSLVEAGNIESGIGTVCGKLLTIKSSFDLPDQPLVDSTGIYFTPMLRHLDRGSQEVDNGHYLNNEYVFGATAAAALYRREMIDDIALDGEFFDRDFFVYREDADVAWRAQLLGWRCMYTPHARGYHVRKVLPGNRRELSAAINMHSVKNRFLMRLKNITGPVYRKHWLSITARDLIVVGCCIVREHSSLKGLWYVLRNWRRAMEKRTEIMKRRRVSDEYMASWFSYDPVSKPAAATPVRTMPRQKAARGR